MPLRPEVTGFDFWVWCWCAPDSGDVRIVVTRAIHLADGEWSAVALRPALRVADGEPLSGHDLDLLARWLRANGAAVERYWRLDLMFAENFLRSLARLTRAGAGAGAARRAGLAESHSAGKLQNCIKPAP